MAITALALGAILGVYSYSFLSNSYLPLSSMGTIKACSLVGGSGVLAGGGISILSYDLIDRKRGKGAGGAKAKEPESETEVDPTAAYDTYSFAPPSRESRLTTNPEVYFGHKYIESDVRGASYDILSSEPQQNVESYESTLTPSSSQIDVACEQTSQLPKVKVERVKLSREFFIGSVEGDYETVYELFKKNKLTPRRKLSFGEEAAYYVTFPFTTEGNSKKYIVAFVEVEGMVSGQIFYCSDSQGIWRVIPAQLSDSGWIPKGMQESDIALPGSVSTTLFELFTNRSPTHIAEEDRASLFEHITQPGERKVGTSRMSTSYKVSHASVSIIKQLGAPELKTSGKKARHDPKKLTVSKRHRPDFTNAQEMAVKVSELYGRVTVRSVPSKNGKLLYYFYERMADRRAFISTIEKLDSCISMFGNRTFFIKEANLTAPLLEYPSQIPLDYAPQDQTLFHERYQYNWNYIREMPVIKDYYNYFHSGHIPSPL